MSQWQTGLAEIRAGHPPLVTLRTIRAKNHAKVASFAVEREGASASPNLYEQKTRAKNHLAGLDFNSLSFALGFS